MHEGPPLPFAETRAAIGQKVLQIAGLFPETRQKLQQLAFERGIPVFSSNGVRHTPDNLAARIDGVAEAIGMTPEGEPTERSKWFHDLVDAAMHNKKVVVFEVAAVGTLVITSIAGYEGLVRHGRDIRELHHMITDHFQKKKDS